MMFNILVICYLFLGGGGAGVVAVLLVLRWYLDAICKGFFPSHAKLAAAISSVRYYKNISRVMRGGLVISLVLIITGIICLIAHLGSLDRVFVLLTHLTTTWIPIGTLFLSLFVLLCSALLVRELRVERTTWRMFFVERLISVALFIAALGVMAYTGLFLQSLGTGVPLWDTYLIVILFVLSSLSVGIAIVLGCFFVLGGECWEYRPLLLSLSRLDAALVVIELIAVAAFVGIALLDRSSAASVINLLSGTFVGPFWLGVVVCGIAAPLLVGVAGRNRRLRFSSALIPAVVCAVIACFSLRLCVVGAGEHPDVQEDFLIQKEMVLNRLQDETEEAN